MIQVGRAERMIVIAGDNASSDNLMPWLGNGFRALGAATISASVELAALPFDRRRSGMILGSGRLHALLYLIFSTYNACSTPLYTQAALVWY
jgi:3-oxoacyl-(acyl-carrier-protein) synthase